MTTQLRTLSELKILMAASSSLQEHQDLDLSLTLQTKMEPLTQLR